MDLHEKILLKSIKNGQIKPFESLFNKFFHPLVFYANTFLHDMDEAEEVVQNLFCSFWEKRNEIQIETSLSSYLYRAIQNNCLKKIKHAKVISKHVLKVRYENPASDYQELELDELEKKLNEVLKTLPEKTKSIFTLNRNKGLKYREIAENLGISIKTVELHMGNALKVLREGLKEFLPFAAITLYFKYFL